jgi:hypothetical protein
MAIRLGEFDGIALPEPEEQDVSSARVANRLADLVEPAKTTALEKLGEGERAMRVATRWLRTKVVATNSTAPAIE